MAASTQLITDIGTAVADTPVSTTVANAIAAAGPIQDVTGNLEVALVKLKEAHQLLVAINQVVYASDPINTLVANVLLSLV